MNPFSKGTWQVRIWGGFPMSNDATAAPMKFGTPEITTAPDSELTVPLIYGPVILRGDMAMLAIQVPSEPFSDGHGGFYQGYEDVRRMTPTGIEFAWEGEITVEGWEIGQDGTPRFAAWFISVYNPDPDGWEAV